MALYIEALERLTRSHNLPLEAWSDGRPNWRHKTAKFAGNCQSPKTVELFSRPSVRNSKYILVPRDGMAMTVELEVRCRQCPACLKARAAHWRIRAMAEYRATEAVGARNWFATLTISPKMRMHVVNTCRRGKYKIANWDQGIDFDALSPSEQFRAKHSVISKELTKFVKRVRFNSGADIRLLCVAEAHKDGEPHYHMLIHEMRPDQPVRKRILKAAWHWGHSDFKLCQDKRAASYVCKYLTKSSLARVRASLRYGERPDDIGEGENLEAVFHRPPEGEGLTGTVLNERGKSEQLLWSGLSWRWQGRPRLSRAVSCAETGAGAPASDDTATPCACASSACTGASASVDPPQISAEESIEAPAFAGI